MSIVNILENKTKFSGANNIRIAIAGLAICKFTNGGSTIRFLRHLDDHKLKMKIIRSLVTDQQPSKPIFIDAVEYIICKNSKQITFEGADRKEGFAAIPTYREPGLNTFINLHNLHGNSLQDKPGVPLDGLTEMTITNCHFYTAKLTDHKFNFLLKNDDSTEDSVIEVNRKFGEILGGYMKVSPTAENPEGKLTIYIRDMFPSERIELKTQEGDESYIYEIQFNNSCFDDNGIPCPRPNTLSSAAPTDFLKIYDVLVDNDPPRETFDLKPIEDASSDPLQEEITSINTGACLPVVEEPPLN